MTSKLYINITKNQPLICRLWRRMTTLQWCSMKRETRDQKSENNSSPDMLLSFLAPSGALYVMHTTIDPPAVLVQYRLFQFSLSQMPQCYNSCSNKSWQHNQYNWEYLTQLTQLTHKQISHMTEHTHVPSCRHRWCRCIYIHWHVTMLEWFQLQVHRDDGAHWWWGKREWISNKAAEVTILRSTSSVDILFHNRFVIAPKLLQK